jgi:hypothetical protein
VAKKITMTFWRDDSSGPACLEYSWVPEGLRHTIQLDSGQREGSETDTISDELNPSHVQVYRLNNFEGASTEKWQFPDGPPHALPVGSAKIDVFQSREVVVGIVIYTDSTNAASARVLDSFPRPCPEIAPTKKVKR